MSNPLPDEYQEHVLNACDVCRNCFAIVREERDSHAPTSQFNAAALEEMDVVDRPGNRSSLVRESYWGRDPRHTVVSYFPAETAGACKQIFCTCGVASAFDRYWTWRDISRDRFKQLLQNLLRSAERKGLTLAKQPAAAHALSAFDSHPLAGCHGPVPADADYRGCIDDALATGLLAGLRIGAVRSSTAAHPAD